MREEQDDKLINHSSEALARMHECVAVYEIFPRMRCTENRVLKRSLAATLGAFFGAPDAFYKLFSRELLEPCSESERLLRKIQKQAGESARNKRAAKEQIELFRIAYEREQWVECIEPLLSLAQQIARKEFGCDRSEVLNSQNWNAGLSLWLIERLHEVRHEGLYPVEVLLALYVLSCWPSPTNVSTHWKNGRAQAPMVGKISG